jgi:hypothetical protein
MGDVKEKENRQKKRRLGHSSFLVSGARKTEMSPFSSGDG